MKRKSSSKKTETEIIDTETELYAGEFNRINDKPVMAIGVVFFGIVIPNATGLVEHNFMPIQRIVSTYLYFITVAFFIWFGNRFLFFRLQEKYGRFNKPSLKIIFLVLSNVFYTAPVTAIMISAFYYIFHSGNIDWKTVEINIFVCVVCVIFVTQVYETIFLAKQRESEKIRSEQYKRAKAEAELEALKNQVDPHFIYNSLNSLSYLIDNNIDDAKLFVENMAEVFRYMAGNKNRTLVMLEDEILFLKKYISLLDIRFSSSLKVNYESVITEAGMYLIPPNSIFIAVENVVKHNELSKNSRLDVDMEIVNEKLVISNKIRAKKPIDSSTKIGLKNLDERFRLITGEGIKTIINNGVFELALPMLKINN